MWRKTLAWAAVVLIAVAVLVSAAYFRDMNRAHARINGKSQLIPSPEGDIEYTEGGAGPAVLVIHGSGGGYDNGAFLARVVLGDQFRWIAPSRFGYLRSTFRAGATFDDQAHAYAHLLDHLGLQKVAVVAVSHGGPGALLFAALHPERVSSLTLISAGVASSPTAAQSQANRKGDMLTTIFQHDFLYWSVSQVFRNRFLALMGANEAVIASLTPEQRALADEVIDGMNPVAPRSAGVMFDNQAAMPNERVALIQAPTLIFHARDDTLQLYRNAEFAASAIRGAQLVGFEKGGHLLVVVEQAAVRAGTRRHIVEHADKPR